MEPTYSESVRQAEQQRQRAIFHENRTDLKNSSLEKIKRLEAITFDERPLATILECSADVDRELQTHSSMFTTGGSLLWMELRELAGRGLDDLRAKAAKHQAKIDQARKDLARAEAALAELA